MVRNGIAVEVLRVENWDYKPKGKAAVKPVQPQDDTDSEIEEEEPVDYNMDIKASTPSTSQPRKRTIYEVLDD